MRIGFTQRMFKDLNRIRFKLDKADRDIEIDTQSIVVETGEVAFNFALSTAPEFTGALKQAMSLNFPDLETFEIRSRHPKGDVLPIHQLFDTGDYPSVTGQQPRKSNSLFFMQKTFVFAEQEFNRRLRQAIRQNIQKIGKSNG